MTELKEINVICEALRCLLQIEFTKRPRIYEPKDEYEARKNYVKSTIKLIDELLGDENEN